MRKQRSCFAVAIKTGLAYKWGDVKPLDFSYELKRLMDPYWRKARIAARLLIKREEGKPWSPRDQRLAQKLARDTGVTNRLLDQAYCSHTARKRNGRSILDIIP